MSSLSPPQHDFEYRKKPRLVRVFSALITVLAFGTIVVSFANISMITREGTDRVLSKTDEVVIDYDLRLERFLYYNLDPEHETSQIPLPKEHYPLGEGPVIALLVSGRAQDIEEAQTALKSLAFLKGDKDPEHPAPVLIFSEGDISKEDILAIARSTNRPVSFPTIDFTFFPPGFDSEVEKIHFRVKGRNPWGYYQMIRFWTTLIWKQAAIERFDTVMRIDSDSCFKEVNDYLPNFQHDGLYYHSQYVGVEPVHGANYIAGMYDFAVKWMETTKQPSEPRNALFWHYLKSVWENEQTLPLFRTNFELSKRSFMQRGDVARFHDAVTEKAPFPVLRHRWGDAVLRFLLVAVFESPSRVMTVKPEGYFHKNGCSRKEVEEALRILNKEVKEGSSTSDTSDMLDASETSSASDTQSTFEVI